MTAHPDSALHYAIGRVLPERGRTRQVAPGVHWMRMPLPFALDHINLWLLRDVQDGVEGWTVVDCGIADDATRSAWEELFAAELQGLPILRVLCTHMHPDHIGLAHWLCERFSTPTRECRLWISSTDWTTAHVASRPPTGLSGDSATRFFSRHGLVDAQALQRVRQRAHYYARMVPQVPASYRRLMHGQVLRVGGHDWRCIVGYGHSPEHIALHCAERGLLISGDMVLPRISTNISVYDVEPEGNPLALYLDSIAALRSLPPQTMVLPSHGLPFIGLHTRIDQLQRHHEERLAEVLAACRHKPCNAAELLPVLFKRELDLHQTTFAMGEAIAHLHALAATGQLLLVADDSGTLRYRAG